MYVIIMDRGEDMNTKVSRIIVFFVILSIIGNYYSLGSILGYDVFGIPIAFFIIIWALNFGSKKHANKRRDLDDYQDNYSYHDQQNEKHYTTKKVECEYYGKMNGENEDYCAHCGAQIIHF